MTDYFAMLGLPRRPGLDEEVLKENYLRLAAAWHPDAGGDVEKFRDLQEARKTLLDPAARLRHLLALEGFDRPAGGKFQPPADLFLGIAGALDSGKKAVLKFEAARSSIARAAVAAECVAAGAKISLATEAVAGRIAARLSQIKDMDSGLETNPSLLEEISAELVFLNRWDKELRERLFLLGTLSAS